MSETEAGEVEKALLALRRKPWKGVTPAYLKIYEMLPQLTYRETNELRLILVDRLNRRGLPKRRARRVDATSPMRSRAPGRGGARPALTSRTGSSSSG
jgi:hypothetical protein